MKIFKIIIRIIIVVFIIACTCCIVFVYNSQEQKYASRTLFFVEPVSENIVIESHLLPVKETEEENIELLVAELLLGPNQLTLNHILPVGTRTNHVIYREHNLYIDLNSEAVIGDNSCLSFYEGLHIIEKCVTQNFPDILKIVFTVNGNVLLK